MKHSWRACARGPLRSRPRCPSRAPGGVLPRPESASSYHGRPPAIHGRLGAHPRCTRRALRSLASVWKSAAVPPKSRQWSCSCIRIRMDIDNGSIEVVAHSLAVDLPPDATTGRSPPRPQGDVQSRPWMAGGRMWEQDAEISGWASPCGRGGRTGLPIGLRRNRTKTPQGRLPGIPPSRRPISPWSAKHPAGA